MNQEPRYTFMTRKELSVASGVSERTLYVYICANWPKLRELGCEKHKRLTPSAVKYICENYGINL